MPPQGIPCDLCGGMFFQRSMAIHRKQCALKLSKQMTVCADCNKEIPMINLKEHLASCPAFNKGFSSGMNDRDAGRGGRRPLLRKTTTAGAPLQAESTKTIMGAADHQSFPPPSSGGGAGAYDGDGGLVPCRVCSRTFSVDRIQKHMGICQQVKKKRRVYDEARHRMPKDGNGDCIPMSKHAPDIKPWSKRDGSGTSIDHVKTNWREKSAAFRQIAKDCREWESQKKRQNPPPMRGGSMGGRGTPSRIQQLERRASGARMSQQRTVPGKTSMLQRIEKGPPSRSRTMDAQSTTMGSANSRMQNDPPLAARSLETPPGSRQAPSSGVHTRGDPGRSSQRISDVMRQQDGMPHHPSTGSTSRVQAGSRENQDTAASFASTRNPRTGATTMPPGRARNETPPPGGRYTPTTAKIGRSNTSGLEECGLKTSVRAQSQDTGSKTGAVRSVRQNVSSGRIQGRDPSPAIGTRTLVTRNTKEPALTSTLRRAGASQQAGKTASRAFNMPAGDSDRGYGRSMGGGGGGWGGGNFSMSNETSSDNPMVASAARARAIKMPAGDSDRGFGRKNVMAAGGLAGAGSGGWGAGGSFSASNEVSRDNPMVFR